MEENKTIKLDHLTVLSFRALARYRSINYGEYLASVNVVMDILSQIPKPIQEKLVKSDFLLDSKNG